MGKNEVAILVDSTSCLPNEIIDKYGIHIIPQKIIIEGKEYKDNIDIDTNTFDTLLKNQSVFPKTSQASPAEFVEVIKNISDKKDVLCIVISSELSGTYNSAVQASKIIDTRNVQIIDSQQTGMGLGLLAIQSAILSNSNKEASVIYDRIVNSIEYSGFIFMVSTLDYLKAGGRANRLPGINSELDFYSIFSILNGRVIPVDRTRTRKKAFNIMSEYISSHVVDHSRVKLSLVHTNELNVTEEVKIKLNEKFDTSQVIISSCSPVLEAHSGPGAFGIGWLESL